jgi:hypothetical protein
LRFSFVCLPYFSPFSLLRTCTVQACQFDSYRAVQTHFFCFSPFRLPIVSKTLSRLTLCFSLWFPETAAQAPRRGRFHPVVLLAEQRRNAESAHHTPASQILRVGRQRVATIKGKYSGTILSSLKRKKNTGFGFFRRRFLPLGSGNLRSLFVQVRQVLFIPTSSARSYTRQY